MDIKHLSHFKRGTNQYSNKPKFLKAKTKASIAIVLLTVAILEVPLFTSAGLEKRLNKIKQSFHVTAYANSINTDNLTATQQEIVNYIYEVFGDYGDEAVMIAKCESGIKADAIGTNADSKDYGVMQINDYYHGFNKSVNNPRHLLDYKINILMAWNIFKGNNYSWSLWMCSDKVGLN